MTDEENVVETVEQKKEPVNIWKILLISLVSIGVAVALCVGIYNSDWFINKTLQIKRANDLKLGKHTTWSYVSKYENNRLKMNLTFKNVDEKIMKIADNYLDKDEDIVQLVFMDKDGFKLAELKIPKEDFVHITSEKGQYSVQCSLMIDKKNIRQIESIEPKYKGCLDMRYSEMMKEIDSRYRKTVNNLFGF